MSRPLLLDVDTGVDDAIAIALATRLVDHSLVAVTTVAGNVPIEFATDNTLKVLAWLKQDIPVYRGASEPLVRALHTAREHHGHDGLGGWTLPSAQTGVQEQTAPEAIVRLAREHRGDITFVFVGPLTNLAIALNLEPRIADWVHRLVIMGGAFFGPGNVTSDAEFNIFVDPEAAAAVARSGVRATWVGLDVSHQTSISSGQWARLAGPDEGGLTLVREVTRQALTELGRAAIHLHDPLAVAVAERPQICTYFTGDVGIDTGHVQRGKTRVTTSVGPTASANVAREVDQHGFDTVLRMLVDRS
ncbi:MAG TPA: nucleoside hydrolase [Thermomicrobiales bacterium]|nr:nucleoside hydrolase [Thermomicrobiales bacterium]